VALPGEPIVGQLQNEALEEVAGDVRADHEHLRWVGIRVDIDNDERMVHGVEDVRVRDAVTSSRRWISTPSQRITKLASEEGPAADSRRTAGAKVESWGFTPNAGDCRVVRRPSTPTWESRAGRR